MFLIYEQRWKDGRVSQHRQPEDILEFARNQNPIPERDGKHKNVRVHVSVIQSLEGTLGKWK